MDELDWDSAITAFLAARGTPGWERYWDEHEAAVVRRFCGAKDTQLDRLADALCSPDEKWFVAYLARIGNRLPLTLYEPMLRAGIDEPNPSFNRSFIDPCVKAVGGLRVISDLLDVIEHGPDNVARAGAARALCWAWIASSTIEADVKTQLASRQRCLLLTTFVWNADVRLRQCIVPQLDVTAHRYSEDMRPLVAKAIAIARAHEDEYISHRIEVQLGTVKVFKPLPEA